MGDPQSIIAEVQGWPPDLREWFEERSAIMEYDGKLKRLDAERLAYEAIKNKGEENE